MKKLIKVTLSLDDWKLLVAYFEGDVEAMGDNAPELQDQARQIQNAMRRAIALHEREVNAAMEAKP